MNSKLLLIIISILIVINSNGVVAEDLLFIDDMNYSLQSEAESGGWFFDGTNAGKSFLFDGSSINVSATGSASGIDAFARINLSEELGVVIKNYMRVEFRVFNGFPQTRWLFYNGTESELLSFVYTTSSTDITHSPQNDSSYATDSFVVNEGYNVYELEFFDTPRNYYDLTINDDFKGRYDFYSTRFPNYFYISSEGGGGSVVLDYLKVYNTSSSTITVNPVFVSPSPVNDSKNNTDVVFNVSCDNGVVYSWFNNSKVLDGVVSPASYSTDTNVSGSYDFVAACYNISLSGFSSNITRVWSFDATYPTINFNGNNAFNINNFSRMVQYDNGSMLLNMSFVDDVDLFAYSINITQNNVNVLFNETNESLSGLSYNFSRLLDVSSWSSGWYDIEIIVSDSHTANKINDYQVTSKKSSIIFKTDEDNNIKIETDSLSDIVADRFVDRYSFGMIFDDGLFASRTFHVKTDKCPLTYKEDSGFVGHFISYCDGYGNWVDFEGLVSDYVVSKIDDFHYTIFFSAVPPSIVFNSIGGLNVYTAYHSWFLGDYSLLANPSGTSVNTTLQISLDREVVNMDNFSALLFYNNTIYSSPAKFDDGSLVVFNQTLLTGSVDGFYPYYWNISYNQSDGSSFVFSVNSTHNVFDWRLYNCSGVENVSFYMNFYDEDTPSSALVSTAELEVITWISDPNNFHNFSYKFTGDSSYPVCIYPLDIPLSMNFYSQYNTSGGFTHRYYLSNHSINNISQNISMFNVIDTSYYSELRIIARDNGDYSFFSGVTTKLLRNYLSESVWRTVQMDRSGDFGNLIFHVREQETDYKLLYFDSENNLLKESDTLKFSCDAGICELTQLLTSVGDAIIEDNISVVYSLDNSTGLLTVDWFDPEGNNNNVEVRVSKETMTGTLVICSVFQVGNAGQVICDVGAYNGDVLLTVLTSHSPYSPITSAWITLSRVNLGSMLSPEDSALWTFGLTLTMLAFGVWSAVAVIIALLFGLIAMFFLGIFTPLSVTFIIVASVMGVVIGVKIKR